jgi:hypothetical protein
MIFGQTLQRLCEAKTGFYFFRSWAHEAHHQSVGSDGPLGASSRKCANAPRRLESGFSPEALRRRLWSFILAAVARTDDLIGKLFF